MAIEVRRPPERPAAPALRQPSSRGPHQVCNEQEAGTLRLHWHNPIATRTARCTATVSGTLFWPEVYGMVHAESACAASCATSSGERDSDPRQTEPRRAGWRYTRSARRRTISRHHSARSCPSASARNAVRGAEIEGGRLRQVRPPLPGTSAEGWFTYQGQQPSAARRFGDHQAFARTGGRRGGPLQAPESTRARRIDNRLK